MGKKAKRKPPARLRPGRPSSKSCESTPATGNGEEEAGEEKEEEEEMIECRHFSRGVSPEKLQAASVSSLCSECAKENKTPKSMSGKKKKQMRKKNHEDEVATFWVCLACGHVGCERSAIERSSFGSGHALEHSRRQRHPLVLQIGDGLRVWCFDCGSFVVSYSELMDGLGSLVGSKGHALQQAVHILQERYFKRAAKNGRRVPEELQDTSSQHLEHKNGVVRGLVNLGNTCFFNSVMQNLLALNNLKEYFLNSSSDEEGPLTSSLRRFYREINSEPGEHELSGKRRFRDFGTYNPKSLFGALCAKSSRFSGYHQQDSHELLRCLLDGLQVEEERLLIGEGKKSQPATFVDKFFGGEFASTVTCSECGYSSSVLEPFLDISLPIPTAANNKRTPSNNRTLSNNKTALSKWELKAKKHLDRRKRTPVTRSAKRVADGPVQGKDDQAAEDEGEVVADNQDEPVSNKVFNNKDGEGSKEDPSDTTWLDYVCDASSTMEGVSWVDEDVMDDYVDLFPKDEIQSVSNTDRKEPEPVEVSPGCRDNTLDDSVDPWSTISSAISLDDPWPTGQSDSMDQTAVVVPGGCEAAVGPLKQEMVTTDEDVAGPSTASGLILLPYWDDAQMQASGSQQVFELDEGLGDLFQEEEVVVASCAKREDGGAAGFVVGAEELELDIVETNIVPMTLDGCLAAFTKLEVLSEENAWACENCSKKEITEDSGASLDAEEEEEEEDAEVNSDVTKVVKRRQATKSLVIRTAPPILTVHLKRFAQDMRGRLSKLTGHVAFEELLDLKPFQGTKNGEACLYRLVGVVEHSGTMKGGHYVAYVRGGGEENTWYYISDSDVRKTTFEQVLRSEAYLLFYERV